MDQLYIAATDIARLIGRSRQSTYRMLDGLGLTKRFGKRRFVVRDVLVREFPEAVERLEFEELRARLVQDS